MKIRRVGLFVIGAIALIASAAALAFASQTPAAIAKTQGLPILWNQSGKTVPVRYCTVIAGTMCNVNYWEDNGTNVTMVCWRDVSPAVTGNYSSVRWFQIRYKYGRFSKRAGWVHSSYVYYQTNSPHC